MSKEHPWSKEALIKKAEYFISKMENIEPTDSEFGLWASFSVELLVRAALSAKSIALLADASDWRNLAYALGLDATSKKPKINTSLGTSEVISRVVELYDNITDEHRGYMNKIINLRNAELHTGEMVFHKVKHSDWLPEFYIICRDLGVSLGLQLSELFEKPEEITKIVEAYSDSSAKAVKGDIAAHQKVWAGKGADEQETLLKQAKIWASRQSGHRVDCPACSSTSLLTGEGIGGVKTELEDDEVVHKQTMLPSHFECVACGLKISGYSKLLVAGLGETFTGTSYWTVAEYFELYTQDDLDQADQYKYEYDWND
ncbi:MAG: hypothetical protein ACFE0P_12750 [Oceanicaulis sp.]